ncbi:MAG TPA: hypothetical protein VLQ80_15770, partial [Candidatus Saccharimonadia bacterium]|nr:hypothetical protein [Candidatus Saccharimonadia bacterium]
MVARVVVRLETASGRVGGVGPDPMAVELTTATIADHTVTHQLLASLPSEVCSALGDTYYNDPKVRRLCEQSHRALVATRCGAYPHHDDGVEVWRIFHKLRSQAIELFKGLFKNVFEWRTQMPVRGLWRLQLLALGAIVIYQLVLLYQHEPNLPLG